MTAPDSQPTGSIAGFRFADLTSALLKRLWLVVAIVIALPSLVGFVVSKRPKVYEASASLVIDSVVPQYLGSQFRDVVEVESNWWSAQEMLQTELRVLRSRALALAVAEALCSRTTGAKGQEQPALLRVVPGSSCATTTDMHKAAPALEGLIAVAPVRESRVVTLTVKHGIPEMTKLLADTYADVYRARNAARLAEHSKNASNWLGTGYRDLLAELKDAENALVDFKKKNGVLAVNIEDQQNDISLRHKKLSEELNSVEVKLIGLRAVREHYSKLKAEDPMLDVTPGVSESAVVQKLKELYVDQYAKLVELRGKYLDKHPTLVAQEARVQAIKQDLVREAQLATSRTEGAYLALVKQERDLRSALDSATHAALQLEQRAVEYHKLKRNFDRLAKLSEQVGGRERETSLAQTMATNNVRVLDYAVMPTVHIAPNLPASVMAAVVVALLLGLGMVVLLEALDSSIKSQEDVERYVGATLIGVVPTISEEEAQATAASAVPVQGAPTLAALQKKGSRDLYVLSHPKSSVAECCRAIRTNILFMRPDKPARTLLITSAGPQEGKTTTAINIAVTFALSGMRVLLVDTDLRRPRLHKAFGVPATPEGVSKAIVGQGDALDMVRETGVPNLWLLPCGAIPPNPAELLHADRFKHIVEQLTNAFDRVIFDSPPVGAVTDATLLSRLLDGTILVARAGVTSKESLLRTRRLVTDGSTGNVMGCVLNAITPGRPGSYGYYPYYYYSRYGEDDEGMAPPKQPSTAG
jgi:capsular exopolysaccharide synthesis family protein